jgi:hypothetical protein
MYILNGSIVLNDLSLKKNVKSSFVTIIQHKVNSKIYILLILKRFSEKKLVFSNVCLKTAFII